MTRAFFISLGVGVVALLHVRAEGTRAADMIAALSGTAGTAVGVGLGAYLVYLGILKVCGKEANEQHDKRAAKRARKWMLGAAAAFVVLAYGAHYAPV